MTETLRAELTGGPCCGHIHVEYVRVDHGNGLCSDSWQCRDCKTPFWPRAGRESASKGEASNVYAPGGVCYAHGPFDGGHCPKWPACSTDPQKPEFLAMGPAASKGEGQEWMAYLDRGRNLIAFLQSCVECGESLSPVDKQRISDWMSDAPSSPGSEREADGWVSVEKFPDRKEHKWVLVSDGELIDVALVVKGMLLGHREVKATHWRPLPAPPRSETEGKA